MLTTVNAPQQAKPSLPAYQMKAGSRAAITQKPSASPSPSSVVSISDSAKNRLKTDFVAPTLTKFSPADGNADVAVNANIELTFSEAIKRGSGTIVLRKASGDVVEIFDVANGNRITISGKTLKIDPTKDFDRGEHYYVTLGKDNVTDLARNNFKGTSSYDFTTKTNIATKTKPDTKAPVALSLSSSDGSSSITPTSGIAIKFSEEIKRGAGTVYLKDAAGRVVEAFSAGSSALSFSGDTMTIKPGTLLASTKYSIELSAGAARDLAGNSYKGSASYEFTTSASTTPYHYADNPLNGSAFNIALDYTGDQSYLTYFQQARSFWENVITADLTDSGSIDDLKITATITSIDGAGGILGSASPSTLRGGTLLPITGSMQFDSADVASMISNSTLLRVIMHEMAHVLGIGSLWGAGYGSFVVAGSGNYTGAQALAQYAIVVGGSPASVPVETGGGAGTADAHWAENIFTDELMTGFATGAMHLSAVTVGALEDLGYTVNYSAKETNGLT